MLWINVDLNFELLVCCVWSQRKGGLYFFNIFLILLFTDNYVLDIKSLFFLDITYFAID